MNEPIYEPIGCNHKKENGFSSYMFLSESSGSGPNLNYMEHISVCTKCGEIKVGGQQNGHRFNVEFSLHYPEAVAAIVKFCNYINKENEDYIPFVREVNDDPVI